MQKLLFSGLLLVLCLSQATVASAQDTLDRALLWRIDVPDAPAPSYLFGTIHLIGEEDFLLSDSLMQALNRSERVVFEIDPAEMSDMGTAMSLMTQAFMPGNTSLRDLLTKEEYAAVDAHFAEKGLPMMFLDRIKPMFLSMLANIDLGDMGGMFGGPQAEGEEGDAASSSIKSYELELNTIARDADKAVAGLETTAFQMSLFDSIPLSTQAEMLVESIENPETDQLEALTQIYISGDIEGMYELSAGSGDEDGGFERTLIVNRNHNWIAPMLKQSAAGPTLFAVGAGHLGGPEGVIRLLQAKGATLTPMSVR